jgi:hypothetical protein
MEPGYPLTKALCPTPMIPTFPISDLLKKIVYIHIFGCTIYHPNGSEVYGKNNKGSREKEIVDFVSFLLNFKVF